MASVVYSANLFRGVLSPAFEILFTIPDDKTGVLRDIELYNGDVLEPAVNFQVGLPGSTTIVWSVVAKTGTWSQWRGDLVVPSGQSIWGYPGSASDIHACLSGYLLTNP